MVWYQDGPAFEFAVVDRLEDSVDLVEWMLFHERCDLDAAAQDHIQRGRVEFRRTSPIAERAGVVRHEIGEPNLDLVHGEADHAQRGAMIDQAECGFLPGARARTFEDDPFGLPQRTAIGETLYRRFDFAGGKLSRIQSQGRTLLRDRVELVLIDVHGNNGAA